MHGLSDNDIGMGAAVSVGPKRNVVFTNARVALPDRMIEGTVRVEDGLIASVEEVGAGPSSYAGDEMIDCDGDILMPGMVELHTDNIEKHVVPRPGAQWPALPAAIAHDAQVASAGITTVFDAVAVGAYEKDSARLLMLQDVCDALEDGTRHGVFKASHIVHLRCEVGFGGLEALLDPLIEKPRVGLISIMDHTPGQRQFTDLQTYRNYYMKKHGYTEGEMDQYIAERIEDQKRFSAKNRAYAVGLAQKHGFAIASHDDATAEHVEDSVKDGMTIAEFPTTFDAAKASHESGLAVLMGAPNVVRGGSHSGNVAARDLAERGHLDILSSDYAPAALIHAAFLLDEQVDSMSLPEALATVTCNPARAAGLNDRGEIAVGLKADLLRIEEHDHHPLIQGVWRGGRRVA